jgi:sorbitol-6-phosphate 2-dehydrogenase
MHISLEDRVAVVTGGGQGLGQAICQRLAREGCDVVVADINAETATRTAAELNAYYQQEGRTNRRAIAMRVDVTKEDEVAALVDRTVQEFGRLDIFVANAGILISGEIDQFPADKWEAVIRVNLIGYFLCAKHACRVMKQQRSGTIIQINSKSGKRGSYKNSAYAASKFGGIGLTQSLALEMAEYGVRVNAICPGNLLDSPLWVESLYSQYAKRWGVSEEEVRRRYLEQVPLGRGCTYDDVCNILVYLASDAASYMTGLAISVTGGQEMN